MLWKEWRARKLIYNEALTARSASLPKVPNFRVTAGVYASKSASTIHSINLPTPEQPILNQQKIQFSLRVMNCSL